MEKKIFQLDLDDDASKENGPLLEVDKNENADLRLENTKLKAKVDQLQQENDALKQQILKMEADKNSPAGAESSKAILVPNWLLEVLAWIRRTEMATSSLPTASSIFKQLCWPKLHENVLPKTISSSCIKIAQMRRGNRRWATIKIDEQILKMPSIKPPKYIQGFGKDEIEIRYLDKDVLRFFENILPLLPAFFDVEIKKDMFYPLEVNDQKWTRPFNRLMRILAPKLNEVYDARDGEVIELDRMAKLFPPDIVGQVQTMNYSGENLDLVLNWLLEERTTVGKPKLISLFKRSKNFYNELFERIKEEFLHSTQPKPFSIWLGRNHPVQFTPMENEHTGEVLAMFECEIKEEGKMHMHLGRYPNGEKGQRNRERWANQIWEFAPMRIAMDIRCIGKV